MATRAGAAWDRGEVEVLLRRAVERAGHEPASWSLSRLAAALPAGFRPSREALREILDGLVSRGILHVWPGRAPGYAAVPFVEVAAARVLAELQKGRSTRSKLARASRLPLAVCQDAVKDLVGSGRVFQHPRLGNRQHFGLSPADPLDYARGGLETVVRGLGRKGFLADDIRGALVRFAEGLTGPREKGADHEAALLGAMREIEPQLDRGAPVSIAQLRARLSTRFADKRAFDDAVLGLAESGRFDLQSHDLPSELSDQERDALIDNSRGSYFMAIGLRRD